MKNKDLQIGDRVVVCEGPLKGETGVLKGMWSGENLGEYWAVELDNPFSLRSIGQNAHDARGLVPSGNGFFFSLSEVKKAEALKVTVSAEKLDALIIGDTEKEEILSVLKQHENRDKLFDDWGLGETIEYGRGMTFMFYGPPGTGKTWAATCIAKALGTDLLSISTAEIQSSEPGEANRAIQEAFAQAEKERKVLFLDECDSLITSRSDVGMISASEINTLLTEIEKFEGVAILATNRIETMDEALERRISLIIEFPLPDYASRQKIWRKLLPEKLPLATDVKIENLAKVKLSGGQIKNVILQAARMALGSGCEQVKEEHFLNAIERIRKSRHLMGSHSRYRQGMVQDYGVNTETGKKQIKRPVKELEEYLDEDEDEEA